jgi:hypothetical protein
MPFSQQRCVFELDTGEYNLSSARLVNLGYVNSDLTAATGVYYPPTVGVGSIISRAEAYLGNVLIAKNYVPSIWLSRRHLLATNTYNEDIYRAQDGTSWSFDINHGPSQGNASAQANATTPFKPLIPVAPDRAVWSTTALAKAGFTLQSYNKDYYNEQGASIAVYNGKQPPCAADPAWANSFSVLLSDLFEEFRTWRDSTGRNVLPSLPTGKLRIELTWNQDQQHTLLQDPQVVTASRNPWAGTQTVSQPALMVDQYLTDVKPEYQIQGIGMLSDQMSLGAVANNVQQFVSNRFLTFDQRFVYDLMLVNVMALNGYQDNAMPGSNNLPNSCRFPAMKGERVEPYINGSSYLPSQGDYHPGTKMYFMNDALGGLNVPALCYWYAYRCLGAPGDSGRLCSRDTLGIAGQFSFSCYKVNDVIGKNGPGGDSLQLNYYRTGATGNIVGGAANPDLVAAFRMYILGTVRVNLNIAGGRVQLSY